MGETELFIQGGFTANKNGAVLEDAVRSVTARHGYAEINFKDWEKANYPIKYLVANVPYQTIYKTRGHTEFVLSTSSGNIRIECKWQQSTGSVDEKYPYLFENMKNVPEPHVIILLGGGGYKKQAREWLLNKCINCDEKVINLFSLEDFTIWANKTLPRL